MKWTLLIFFYFAIPKNVLAQYTIDASVKKEFDSIFHEQKPLQNKNQLRYLRNGIAFLTYANIDTLNNTDVLIDTFYHEFSSVDTTSKTNSEKAIFATRAITDKDTLILASCAGFMYSMCFEVKYFDSTFNVIFNEQDVGSSSYKRTLNDETTDGISLKTLIKELVVSEIPSKNTYKLYGKVTIEVPPFYSESGRFKSDYLYAKKTFSFIFMCNLRK